MTLSSHKLHPEAPAVCLENLLSAVPSLLLQYPIHHIILGTQVIQANLNIAITTIYSVNIQISEY